MAIQINFSLALVIMAGLALLGFIFYLGYRKDYKEEKKKPKDPFFVAIVVGIFTIIVVLIMEGVGIVSEGFAKNNWWFFILIMITTFVLAFRNMQKLKPLEESKLESIVWRHIKRRSKADPHKGDAYGSPLPFNNITPTKEGGAFGKAVNYIARTNFMGGIFILVSLDMTNGYLLRYVEDPDTLYVKRLFGKEVTQQYDLEREFLTPDNIKSNISKEGEDNQVQATETHS